MPSVKEIYHKIDDVRIEADTINLNVDGLEALASTQQADVAAIKADLADGIPVSAASLPLPSGAATSALQSTANTSLSSIDAKLPSSLASDRLKVDGSGVVQPAEIRVGGSPAATNNPLGVSVGLGGSAISTSNRFPVTSNTQDGSGNAITSTVDGSKRRLDVTLSSAGTIGSAPPTTANLYAGTDGTFLRAISTDSSGRINTNINGTVPVSGTFWQATQPVSGTVTANAGTGSFTVAQATAANLKGQVQILNSAGSAVVAPAEVGTAGSPSIDVLSVQGVSSGTPLAVRPRNGAITRTTGTTSGTANTSTQALASNTDRQYLLIQNISDTDMYFNFGAAATTSNLLIAKSGGGIVFESGYVPTDAVNVICSAASKSFFILSA